MNLPFCWAKTMYRRQEDKDIVMKQMDKEVGVDE